MISYSSLLLALTAAAAPFASAQDVQPPQASPIQPTEAWIRFQQQHGASWSADWNKATGTPSSIRGPGLRVSETAVGSVQQARDLARALLDEHADLLGTGDSRFEIATAVKVGGTYVLTYDQRFREFDVLGGRADVRLHESGVVSKFGAIGVSIPADLRRTPVVDRDTAFETACDHVGVLASRANARAPRELVLYSDVDSAAPSPARLAWQITVDMRQSGDLVVGRACIDATSGTVLKWTNDVYECWEGHEHVSPRAYGGYAEPLIAEDLLSGRGRATGSLDIRHAIARDHAAKSTEAAGALATARPIDLVGTVMGWVNTSTNGLAATTNVPMPDIRVDGPNGSFTFTDANGNFVIPFAGTNPVTVSVQLRGNHIQDITPIQGTRLTASAQVTPGTPATLQLSSATAGEFDQSQMDTYWWTTAVNNYSRGILGNVTGLNIASNIVAFVNVDSANGINGCNAFYTGNTMTYFASQAVQGPDCRNTSISTVIAHEWGHGLDDRFGGITQQDGLSEGWGDTIGAYQSAQPLIGQGFFANGGIIRTTANSRQYPNGGFGPPSPQVAPHPQGEVWAGFCWDVRDGLIASLGSSAGIARAEQIAFGSIVTNARNQIDAVEEVFVLDDDDGNLLNGTPNYDVLVAAAEGRNLPYPERRVGVITHAELATTDVQLTPRLVNAIVLPLFGSFTQIELVYDAGNGTVRVPMIQQGATFNYRALLPGLLAPASVSYRIEATHSDGDLLTLPADGGDFDYVVGTETILFEEDFENGAPGWSSQQIATQNDWQLGNPNGASGTSFGVAWSDPSSAFSGSNIYGNDLAPPNFNGAYAADVSNFLQAPVISLAGQVDAILQFRRWLTVEEGIFDQATITANGQTIFANPLSGNLVDTSWTLQEISLSAFDGQSIGLRWNLVSDGGLQLGGWNIDDVRVVTTSGGTPPAVQLDFAPPQVAAGNSTTMSIRGAPGAPIALLLSLDPTPVSVPGVIDLEISPPYADIALTLDAQGELDIVIPTAASTSESLVWFQVVQVDTGLTLTPSNLSTLFVHP